MLVHRGAELDNPWAVLGVPVGADRSEIRKRYRKVVATEHPDVKPGDPEAGANFAKVNTAYTKLMEAFGWLGDPFKRLALSRARAAEVAKQRQAQATWVSDEYWAAVNIVDSLGRTVLHRAAANGRADECLAVLARDSFTAVNARDLQGATALHFAAKRGLVDVCQAMLGREDFTAVDAKEKQGKTALHFGAVAGHTAVCQAILLCEAFAEVNAQDSLGRTAWNLAALRGHFEVCAVIAKQPDFQPEVVAA